MYNQRKYVASLITYTGLNRVAIKKSRFCFCFGKHLCEIILIAVDSLLISDQQLLKFSADTFLTQLTFADVCCSNVISFAYN